MAKELKLVPVKARGPRLPLGGTVILILWQRSFAWPSWIYAVVWTLWGIVILASLWHIWKVSGDDNSHIGDETWRRIFG